MASLKVVVVLLALLVGCNRCPISHVTLNDPDAGIAGKIVVGNDGKFFDEVKNGNVVGVLIGSIQTLDNQRFNVSLEYDRKTYSSETTLKSEKLNCTLTAGAGVEIAIGKTPGGQEAEAAEDENALERLTIKLGARR